MFSIPIGQCRVARGSLFWSMIPESRNEGRWKRNRGRGKGTQGYNNIKLTTIIDDWCSFPHRPLKTLTRHVSERLRTGIQAGSINHMFVFPAGKGWLCAQYIPPTRWLDSCDCRASSCRRLTSWHRAEDRGRYTGTTSSKTLSA